MSVEIGAGARWQEITHLVNRGGCGQTKKGEERQESPSPV